MKISILKNNQKHTTEGLGLLILFSGSVTLESGLEKGFNVKKRNFLIYHTGFEISTASPYLDGYLIDFQLEEDDKLQGMLSQLRIHQQFFESFRLTESDGIKELVLSLFKHQSDIALAYSYGHILLSKLLSEINSPQEGAISVYEKFKLLIDDNIQNNYCAGEYAEMLEVPITTLIQEVKNEVDKTPCKVITEGVISYAQNRLLNTNDSSKMIAHQLGFDDPYYFIKYFKKSVGITPTQFRKKQLQETG